MIRFMSRVRISILTACLLLTCLTASGLTLAKDGKPTALVVVSATPSPSAKEAVKVLVEHLAQISEATFKVVDDTKLNDDETYIAVGESTLTRNLGVTTDGLGPGGIIVRTFPKALVLLGADQRTPTDPQGAQYAVTTFLEDHLGVRFLWPGELGKVVPKRPTIRIGEINHRFTPRLLQRRIRMGGSFTRRMEIGAQRLGVTGADFKRVMTPAKTTESYDLGWGRWHRMGGSLRLASGHSFGHMWEKYAEQHPEWFALAPGGSRDQSNSPERSRLCVSNPDLIKAITDELIAKINRTKQSSVAIGPNDGGTTSFCSCKNCEALDAPSERKIELIDFSPGANRRKYDHVPLTDRYVHFWNGIAERVTAVHPKTWLTADAYSAYRFPPINIKLHPNIAIRFVGVSYLNEQRRREGIADWDAWGKAASKIYFRSNLLLAGRRQGTALVYVHKLAEDFSKLAPNRMIGTDLDSCLHHWATQGLNYYVMARLLWNPQLDIDALLGDYCRAGFGGGADAVKRYFLRLESLTDKIAANELAVYDPFVPGTVAELRDLLDEAAHSTRKGSDAHRRVGFLRVGLEYTAKYADVFRAWNKWVDAGGGRLTTEQRQVFREVIERNWHSSRDIFENQPLAVNVTSVAWGSWGYFGRMGWSKPSAEVLQKWR